MCTNRLIRHEGYCPTRKALNANITISFRGNLNIYYNYYNLTTFTFFVQSLCIYFDSSGSSQTDFKNLLFLAVRFKYLYHWVSVLRIVTSCEYRGKSLANVRTVSEGEGVLFSKDKQKKRLVMVISLSD